MLLQTHQSSTSVRNFSQQFLYLPVFTRSFYICISQEWIMYLVWVLKCRQLDVVVSNYLYNQSVSSMFDQDLWLSNHYNQSYEKNLQLLVQFPSLSNKCRDMKYKIILHIRNPSIFPLFSAQHSNIVNCI